MRHQGLLRLPPRILFGCESILAVGSVARSLGSNALVLTDETMAKSRSGDRLLESLRSAGLKTRVFSGCEPDVPLACVERAAAFARRAPFDVVIGFGGGSSIDVAKLVALLRDDDGPLERYYGEERIDRELPPIVAVPTTAGTGSEVSPVAVLTDPDHELKVGISSTRLIPTASICDPEATLGCPPQITGFAGIDALAHAVESYCAPQRDHEWVPYPHEVFRGRDVLSRHYALPAIELLGSALERAFSDGADLTAREDMLLGSLWAGISFAHQGTAGAHALQYPLGALTGTPHGLGVGLVLPYTLEAARPKADEDLRAIAGALGVEDGPEAAITEIQRLGQSVGIPPSLSALGVSRERLPKIAAHAAGIDRLVRNSPTSMDAQELLAVLEGAWAGERRGLAREAGAREA